MVGEVLKKGEEGGRVRGSHCSMLKDDAFQRNVDKEEK